jgi:predicted nucleic acid-binding protein
LDELGCLDLLTDFRSLFVVEAVWNEVGRHRPSALRRRRVRLDRVSAVPPAQADLIELAKAFSLGEEVFQSLVLMGELTNAILLTDDAAARLAAEKLSYEAHGTLGVVVRALRRKQRTKRQVINSYAPFREKARYLFPSHCLPPPSIRFKLHNHLAIQSEIQ